MRGIVRRWNFGSWRHSSRSRRNCTSGGPPSGYYISAPSLSELIQRLERELGTPLFIRTTRRVAITSAGTELLTRAKTILGEVDAAQAAVRRIAGGEAGTIRLGITPPAAPTLAPHLLRLFKAQAPRSQWSQSGCGCPAD